MIKDFIKAIKAHDESLLTRLIDPFIACKIPNKDSIFNHAKVIDLLIKLEDFNVIDYYKFLSYWVVEFTKDNLNFVAKIKHNDKHIYQIYVEEKRFTKRLCVRYAYNGTLFYGSQRQVNQPSVTGVLEKVFSQYLNHPCELIPASRTDRFVHALDQVAHLDTDSKISLDKLKTILNDALDTDIIIKSINVVPQVFHARFDVVKKSYLYKFVHTREIEQAHLATYHEPFNLNKLHENMMLFLGKHDFKSFSKSKESDFTKRTIHDIEIFKEGPYTCIRLTGDGFLRYMVRMMVGQVLYDLDYHKKTIKGYLENPSHNQAIHIAKAKGLYLEKIDYE
ncbi:MAG: tRNA pseudouridine(38-40) synthase TruA [Candidatus Izemoplasmataceae bacterium]